MNDKDKDRFNAAVDLIQWLDARIAQQVEHRLEQQLAQEREHWRVHVLDLIAAERKRLVVLVGEKHEKIVELVEEKYEKLFNLVQRASEQSTRLAEKSFDRLEAKIDELVAPMHGRKDDRGPPPPTH